MVQAPLPLSASTKASPPSASTKATLLKSCEKVGTNSTTAEHEVLHEICIAIASRQPAGAARERALAVCHGAL
jgi:hypothetical protein